MSKLSFFMLGAPRIETDNTPIVIDRRKAIALIAYLAVTGRNHSRDSLATLLWPNLGQSKARGALRRTLSALNIALEGKWLDISRESVHLSQDAEIWLDVDQFHELLAGTSTHDSPENETSSLSMSSLTEAIELYRDDFMAGFTLRDCPLFDEWQFFQAENLRLELASALERIVASLESQKDYVSGIQYARRWVALDPIQETAHRQLMKLYALSGQRNAALRQYQECVRILREELDVSPQRETTDLHETIQSGQKLVSMVRKSPLPQTKYVKSGDVYIAYQVLGNGPFDLLVVPGFISHLEHTWKDPRLAEYYRYLASISRLILFDKRGTGLSDRTTDPPSVEQTAEDGIEVMNIVGSEEAAIFGFSEGGSLGAMFAVNHPERVSSLIIYGSGAKGIWSEEYPWALKSEQFEVWLENIRSQWGTPHALEQFAPSTVNDERFRKWWSEWLKLGASPRAAVNIALLLKEIDVRSILPMIHIPTLVIHRTGDKAMRIEGGRFMAEQIPGAIFIELPGDDHLWWVGNSEVVVSEIVNFLTSVHQS